MKHTKGQWKYFWNGFYFEVHGADSLSPNIKIFEISKKACPTLEDKDLCSLEETEANAKLIASAPELLEALIEVRGKIQYEQGINKLNQQGKDWSKELNLINNAIKKATE